MDGIEAIALMLWGTNEKLNAALDDLYEANAELERVKAYMDEGKIGDLTRLLAVLSLGNLSNGVKIDAIKAYRTLTGARLKESKNAVEAFYDLCADEDHFSGSAYEPTP